MSILFRENTLEIFEFFQKLNRKTKEGAGLESNFVTNIDSGVFSNNPASFIRTSVEFKKLRKGFQECFRVLKPNGILIFKWNECRVPVREILKLTKELPLFGHKSWKAMQTHWICFMKQESPILGEESPAQNTMDLPYNTQKPQGATREA